MYSTISCCRLCKSTELVDLFSLGSHLINAFPDTPSYQGARCPIEVVECKNCTLLQLKHSADPKLLYQTYWYKSGINETIVNDLKNIAEAASKYLGAEGSIMDIGANDGTLLSFIAPQHKRIGVEISDTFRSELNKNCTKAVIAPFEEVNRSEQYDVITAVGMFYDSEDPVKFVKNVRKHLKDTGVFIAQMMAAKQMYENNDIGNLCHEHLEFYTYESLVYLMEASGMEIFKVEENKINGGSYRIYARPYTKGSIKYKEPKMDWEQFAVNIHKNLLDLIVEKTQGDHVYGYGASTKANTMLQYWGIKLEGVADRNPEKIGRYMVDGTPIVSEAEAREKADYFLVFPYGFIDLFIEREKAWLKGGGKFIVPFPNVYVTNGGLRLGSKKPADSVRRRNSSKPARKVSISKEKKRTVKRTVVGSRGKSPARGKALGSTAKKGVRGNRAK